ncbi:NAD-dependent epimerase/dehydratase family protein [Veillonella rodentium]|uniref:dTDP-glucose 4,6-dehydratase n=1 Tax=Veillonella rodentium TaxID=248315 RepID=A0A239YTC8_9FIRM|nr:NAD(P)-dependent oxidoreductase [Veillonella rodentium]SNV61793.1 dTDP-glucose 4,6-dehydratase [Veillonella rodentium]
MNNSVIQRELTSLVQAKSLFVPFRNQRILVTGATGLIGSMFIKLLLIADEVHKLDLHIIGHVRSKDKAKSIFGDFLNREGIELIDTSLDAVDVSCDYILHSAAPTQSKFFVEHPVETIHTSVSGTEAMLELGHRNKVKKLIYLSSMEQYGVPNESGQVMTEDQSGYLDHLNVRSSYSESKRLCECYCKSYAVEYNVPAVIARLAQTFGPGVPVSDNRVFMQFTKSAIANEDIVLHTKGDTMSNYCYITDALSAILVLMHKGQAGEAYNVCNDEETRSIASIANLVAHHVSQDRSQVIFDIPDDVNGLGYAPTVHMFLSSKKLKSLGWEPKISMEEAYIRLAEYIREECS